MTDSGVLGPMLILLNKTIPIFFYIDRLSGPIFSNNRFYFVRIDLKMDGCTLALMGRPPSVCSLTQCLRPKTPSDWLSKSLLALNNLSVQSNQELKLLNKRRGKGNALHFDAQIFIFRYRFWKNDIGRRRWTSFNVDGMFYTFITKLSEMKCTDTICFTVNIMIIN